MRNATLIAVPRKPARETAALPMGWLARFCDWGLLCVARQRERTGLLALDDRALRDVGLTRGDAQREGSKPFWR